MDRLAPRKRPSRLVVMRQTWDHLLFLHWEVPKGILRKMIPEPLKLDTFEGRAYVGLTPFLLRGLRFAGFPPVPPFSRFHEINVRTYVHHGGVPGVWFFSLDADSTPAVLGARAGFSLPYYRARMSMEVDGDRIRYESHRTEPRPAEAELSLDWEREGAPRIADPDSREFFLTERYCLYAASGDEVSRVRIHHAPWEISGARVRHLSSSMLESNGIPTPEGEPLLHAQARPLDVEIFLPESL